MSSLTTTAVLDPPRLERQQRARLQLAGRVAGVAGLALVVVSALADAKRFGFSYLVGFAWVATLALGALFFVQLQHLVRAGWSVPARRPMEWLAEGVLVAAVLFIPLAVFAGQVFPWMGPEAAADPLIARKAAWLNVPFFFVRAGVYFAVWIGLATFFARGSRLQDANGRVELTLRMQKLSAPAMVLFALTVTFASFDWLMSLDPHWYSTIFGVYVFAGAVTSSLAALALLTVLMQAAGIYRRVSTVEHRHDIGKLLFGFVVFWAYIAFCQYFLIWYANIPEETIWYLHRWEGGWAPASVLLMVLQFVLPFVLLLSRAGKRNPWILATAAVLLLAGHYVDLYWLVMPALGHFHFAWADLGAIAGPLGPMLWWVSHRMAFDRLYPVGDPRLHEAVRLEVA